MKHSLKLWLVMPDRQTLNTLTTKTKRRNNEEKNLPHLDGKQ